MAGGGDALPELLHGRALQNGAKLRLPNQKGLQQGLLAKLKIGEHAQFFDGAGGQVLRFVNNEQAALALAGLAHQKGLQGHEDVCLGHVFDAHTKSSPNHAQSIFSVELGGDQVGGNDLVGVETGQETTHDGGFARPDLTGDDNETFVTLNTVFKVSTRSAVLLAAEIKTGVWVELERLAA